MRFTCSLTALSSLMPFTFCSLALAISPAPPASSIASRGTNRARQMIDRPSPPSAGQGTPPGQLSFTDKCTNETAWFEVKNHIFNRFLVSWLHVANFVNCIVQNQANNDTIFQVGTLI